MFGCACPGYVEGLAADRHQAESPTTDLIARPQELYVEFVSERADLRLGYSRIVWGRLDELQPTDVVNPLDLAKFFFEGRAEARIPGRDGPRARLPAGLDDARGRGRAAVPSGAVRPAGRAELGVQPACRHLVPPGTERGPGPHTSWANLQGGAAFKPPAAALTGACPPTAGFETFGVLQLAPDRGGRRGSLPPFHHGRRRLRDRAR